MRTTTVLLLCAVLFTVLPAAADVIYDNGAPDLVESWPSDFDYPAQFAEDFVLQPGATFLTDVHWWGVYANANIPSVSDSFTIRLFADNGGVPDTGHFYEVSGIDGGRVFTGTQEDGTYDIYSYSADIAPVALSANTTYWISIVNDTPNDPDNWYWTTSGQSGISAWRNLDGNAWNGFSSAEFAFYLTGRTVVPEPASLTLLGLGLAGLGARVRRRKG